MGGGDLRADSHLHNSTEFSAALRDLRQGLRIDAGGGLRRLHARIYRDSRFVQQRGSVRHGLLLSALYRELLVWMGWTYGYGAGFAWSTYAGWGVAFGIGYGWSSYYGYNGRGFTNTNVYTGTTVSGVGGAAYNPNTGRGAAGQAGAISNAYTGNAAAGARGASYNPQTGVISGGAAGASYNNRSCRFDTPSHALPQSHIIDFIDEQHCGISIPGATKAETYGCCVATVAI